MAGHADVARACPAGGALVMRILTDKAAFESALKARSVARTGLFSLHRLPAGQGVQSPEGGHLSTSSGQVPKRPVDNSVEKGLGALHYGLVVPKRLAARAVTRNLVKRKARVEIQRHAKGLGAGIWVLRLRAPLTRAQYPSAGSKALALRLGQELTALFGAATHQIAAPTTTKPTRTDQA